MRLLPVLFLLVLLSCKKELKYSKEELLARAQAADPSVALVQVKMDVGDRCAGYTPSCFSIHTVSVRGVELLALEYTTEEEAMSAAKKYRGYYTRNWFFDDVTGEPMLEEFVSKNLEAKKP